MANILYGVNGEGAGHSTRSKEVLSHLVQRGHSVHVVSFDRGLKNLAKDFEVTEIYGLRFAYVNNQVRYRKTLARNLLRTPSVIRSLKRLESLADDWRIDVVVTDFEPLSCAVGRLKRLPIVSIDNQHCLTNARVSYPRRYAADAAAAKLVTRVMTPGADAYLAISFFEAPVRGRKTFLFPPILRQEILRAQASAGSHVLVYVTSPSADLVRILRSAPGQFICYGFEREGMDGNLWFKRPSLETFFADLLSCRAIIGNSGFSLVSEALHLGKPYLAVPVKRQFEQIFNAYYLDKMGYGAYWEELDGDRVRRFLANLDAYAASLAAYPRHDNSALLAKLDDLIGQYLPRSRGAAS